MQKTSKRTTDPLLEDEEFRMNADQALPQTSTEDGQTINGQDETKKVKPKRKGYSYSIPGPLEDLSFNSVFILIYYQNIIFIF